MTVVAIVGVCLVILVLAFLVPRLSRHPQRAADSSLSAGQRAGGKAPGFLGRLFQKPFSSSRRAVSKSGSTGRRARGKMPL